SPYIAPISIQHIANTTPDIMALTLMQEFNFTSATATYFDTIDPYTFSTRNVYVSVPYSSYVGITGSRNYEAELLNESPSAQNASLGFAARYFDSNGSISKGINSSNPAIAMFSQLTHMAQTGLVRGPA
ncbi:Cytochrome b/b6, partial [mine drainage metagenome]